MTNNNSKKCCETAFILSADCTADKKLIDINTNSITKWNGSGKCLIGQHGLAHDISN